MQTKVQKWGNSLAIRIPSAIAKTANLAAGSGVSLVIEEGRIIVEPQPGKRYTLDELLKGVNKKNLHGEMDWGKPAGKEVW